ncbi:hypothetical protein [Thalassotalea marina]|uniref:Uncharacterized protein n=1 Tax=Thalassotalea marina TaxID=1673741 RepID=A0A919EQL0_9GAMM|nr:hypothetical protein [Thalassotalea marina]GHG08405.1 hypothetical protein GCM10017161_42720 [Thalassotalea marina]
MLSVVLILAIFQSQAKIQQSEHISPKAAKESKALATRLLDSIKQPGIKSLDISQSELSGLVALVHRAEPKIHLDVDLNAAYADLITSIETPMPWLFKYINLSARVLPSNQGVVIEHVTLGHIKLSGDTFLYLTEELVDTFVQEGLFNKLIAAVERVEVSEQKIMLNLVLEKLKKENDTQKSFLMVLRDRLSLYGDPEHVSFYYHHIASLAKTTPKKSSIAVYVRHVFQVAQQQTVNDPNTSAVAENQAALMSLAIYFGADRFELMVGDIIVRKYEHLALRNRTRISTTLRERNDLQKHFIYSSALQLFSNVGASDAIGEYKEFLDTNSGGSGFSFADLQADRAGTRLANIVTSSEVVAKKAQDILSTITDEQLLPSIDNLQEGLDEQAFKQTYVNANSEKYLDTLRRIDENLKSLPIYQLAL